MKKFSVITVVFNGRDVIEETVDSVVGQKYVNFEYIVIDGASVDGTLDIIKNKKINGKVISEPDRGIYDAMNKGLALATGEYVIFMNAGDSFASEFTLSELAPLCKDDVVFGKVYYHFDRASRIIIEPMGLDYISKGMPFVHQAAFVKTNLAKSFPFDVNFKIAADYDFFWKLYIRNAKFKYVDKIISNFSAGGVSDNNPKGILECAEIVSKYNPEGYVFSYFVKRYFICSIKYFSAKLFGHKFYALIRKFKRSAFGFQV